MRTVFKLFRQLLSVLALHSDLALGEVQSARVSSGQLHDVPLAMLWLASVTLVSSVIRRP